MWQLSQRTVTLLLACCVTVLIAGCRSGGDSASAGDLQSGERVSAFRDIGKRSASDLTLR